MTELNSIIRYFENAVPNAMKMDFDNVGFLVGDSNTRLSKVLVSLDVTDDVIDEAIDSGAQLILAHHPMFFQLKSVTNHTPEGKKIVKLLRHGIAAICLHTNLDSVDNGVNDALLDALGLTRIAILEPVQCLPDGREYGCGRVGVLEKETDMNTFLAAVKLALSGNGLRYHDAGVPIKKVAICGGSGGSMIGDALRHGCDTLVTADIKYDQFLTAKECGLNLIDADHFCTENVVVPVLVNMLTEAFPELEVEISKVHCQTAQFF